MAGMQQMLMSGGGGIVNPLASANVFDVKAAPVTANGSISYNADGTISYSGGGSGGPGAFYAPAPSVAAAAYFIKFTLNSGFAWSAGLVAGTVYALTSTRTLSWTATSTVRSAVVTASIYSDAGGTNLVTSHSITVDVESS